MSDTLESNPFLSLFESASEVQSFTAQSENDEVAKDVVETHDLVKATQLTLPTNKIASSLELSSINDIVEEIFCLTLSRVSSNRTLIFLDELATAVAPCQHIDREILESALFERLLLEDPSQHVKSAASGISTIDSHTVEREVLTYLFECHKRLMERKATKAEQRQIISEMDDLVIRNVATALTQPDLYASQDLTHQFLSLYNDYDIRADHLMSLLTGIVDEIPKEEGVEAGIRMLKHAFYPILDEIQKTAAESNLLTLNSKHMCLVKMFSSIPILGDILLSHSTPSGVKSGSAYSNTLFGAVLSTSCLPRSNATSYEFFTQPLENQRHTEDSVWIGLTSICDCMHSVFHCLLKNSSQSRHNLIRWIGNCLHSNNARGKLWTTHSIDDSVINPAFVSDGFMINLGSVLLRLCQPFTDRNAVTKLLKVDPTYCAAVVKDESEAEKIGVHMKGLAEETCLIVLNEDDSQEQPSARPVSLSYNFVTECFFMTHKALDLGMNVLVEKMNRLNQMLAVLNRNYEMAEAAAGGNSEVVQSLRQQLETGTTKSLSARATLLEPKSLELMGNFASATALWLVQIAVRTKFPESPSTHAPLTLETVTFPLPSTVSPVLSCIPEFLVGNLVLYHSMLLRNSPGVLEERGTQSLEPLLSQVVVYMGCKQRLRNPHLRASLAECLESLLPHQNKEGVTVVNSRPIISANREALFRYHPLKAQIVRSLLDVFVGIELTGEGVSFEFKFNYRRPMYVAMSYLWKIPDHKLVFKQLAEEAEANMEAVHPPLFLRFLNLLVNDAVYLLDEALSSMAQLRTMQTARENGDWLRLPSNERAQNEQNYQHIGITARSLNILGKETIRTLQYLTTEITSIFSHPALVDRIAAMLNYFLVRLVGPEKKNLKVKDRKEYGFKPADLVLEICRIYVHLGQSDAFCLAVSQDGRSYKPQLFQQAEEVLVRIGGGNLVADLLQVSSRVAEMSTKQETEEEILAEAPDEYLDPIMSCFMMDPVILPSSKVTVDRSTIARHLLSDQSDPFNRSPLTMDQVKPNLQLRAEIHAWVNEKRRQQASKSCSHTSSQ